jgi:hypothetical protein
MPRGVCFVTEKHKAGMLWVTGDPPRPDDAVLYAETEKEFQYVDWQVLVIFESIHGGDVAHAAERLVKHYGGKTVSYSVVLDPEEAEDLVARALMH